MKWCANFDAHLAAGGHEFCETHQLMWCRLCDGACVECRSEDALGEPEDFDDEDFDA